MKAALISAAATDNILTIGLFKLAKFFILTFFPLFSEHTSFLQNLSRSIIREIDVICNSKEV